ncbi:phosphoribosylformylglycinamidine synthase II, partial [Mycobacterium tuberculosis]|nr:phosphoribosylformylglycinamidine synthase II [Mycobacterium tuberculosis]
VSGNVSLYNETNARPILPTPTIGGVGLIDDVNKAVGIALRQDGDVILLVGETTGWLGRSTYLKEIVGSEEGAPPPVDLAIEKK